MKSVCYIQARGGSKRIPHKNKLLWRGVPFVADAILTAEASCIFDLIMVSSDDKEILDIARQFGALPVLRSDKMSGDTITDTELATEILRPLKKFDVVCKLYPCIPLLHPIDLTKAYQMFMTSGAEALRAVDVNGIDAGAFWFYNMTDKPLDTLDKIDYTLDISQDINTYEDIEEARKKDETYRLLG